jgi:hypothetical protein
VAALMLGTTLNPLNSSMIALALVDVGHAFDVSVAAAGALVIVFYASVRSPSRSRAASSTASARGGCSSAGSWRRASSRAWRRWRRRCCG